MWWQVGLILAGVGALVIPRLMVGSAVLVRCHKCSQPFEPDRRSYKPWVCPRCRMVHSNLGLHYRSLAALFVFDFLTIALFFVAGIASGGMTAMLNATQAQ